MGVIANRLSAGTHHRLPIVHPIERPQGHERRLLRLGQSSDPGDVEPFVGSRRAQCAYRFSARYIPQLDDTVFSGTDEHCVIRSRAERANPSLMSLQCVETHSAGHIPPADVSRHTTAEQQRSIHTPGNPKHKARMPGERADMFTAFGIPQENLARRASTATACKSPAIWTPGDTRDAPRMPDQRLKEHPILGPPDPHRAILTTTCQPTTIRAPG